MVGRTPEYLGKKIAARQVKIVVIAILVPFLVVLAFSALAVVLRPGSRDAEHGPPRVQRDPLRLPLDGEQQWLRVRRPHREHALLHDHRWDRDAVGRFVPLLAALALGASVGRERTVPFTAGTLRPTRALRRAADRCHRDHRGVDVPARRRSVRSWSTCREVDLMSAPAPTEGPARQPRGAAAVRPPIVSRRLADSFRKLDPRTLVRNPVIFVVEVVSRGRDDPAVRRRRPGRPDRLRHRDRLGLWFTVLFANFAEAMAEGRGKAQASPCARPRPTSSRGA